MALSFKSEIYKSIGKKIALLGDKKTKKTYPIYYHEDASVDLCKEMDDDMISKLINEISDEAIDETRVPLNIDKIMDVEDAVVARVIPPGRYQAKLFAQIKKGIDKCESKRFEISYNSRDKYEIIPIMPEKEIGQRNACYISGQSGSGKSTLASKLALSWSIQNPDKPIYLFSRKISDPAFDGIIHNLVRVPLDNKLIKLIHNRQRNPETFLEPFSNSLCIFDDFSILEKHMKNSVKYLKDSVFELGRCDDIDIISIQHKSLGGSESKMEFIESNMFGLFPIHSQGEVMKVLDRYVHLKRPTIELLTDLSRENKTRWLLIIRPNIAIGQHFIQLL